MEKFINAFKQMFIRWKDFDGKSTLVEFWYAVIIHVVVSAVFQLLAAIAPFFNYIYGIYGLVILVPTIALGVRRLHDVGEKGTYMLWFLLPIVGWVFVILKWVKPSKVVA